MGRLLTPEYVEQMLAYDPETGIFTWRLNRRRARAGAVAGRKNEHGYILIKINSRAYSAHRLAFFITYGRWPVGDTDHINQNKSDNRIANLREATRGQNKMNCPVRRDSLTGCRGISPRHLAGHTNYQVRINVDGKRVHLGCFEDPELAALVYDSASERFNGEFHYRHAEAA